MGSGVMLSREQLDVFKDIFDIDCDGKITKLELWSLLHFLDLKPNGNQLKALLHKVNNTGHGLVEFSEFVNLIIPTEMNEELFENQKNLVSLFRALDVDGNGFITAVELVHSMAKLGRALSLRELINMIKEADTDGDGRISFTEFASVSQKQKKILALFRAFDRDGNGFITAVELIHSVGKLLGHVMSLRELTDMIKEADTDGDGRISFAEFYAVMNFSQGNNF